ncbi:unnamed protein product [Caenorhabditis brenneri]
MKFLILLLILLLLANPASASQERKRRLCGRALHLVVKRVCPTPCAAFADIASSACAEGATDLWVKEQCCP